MENRRPDRVAEAIREEVATFVNEHAKDPRIVGMVTVTGVEVTRDLKHAKVFVSVMGSEAEQKMTFQGLDSLATHLRAHIGRALRLRSAPEIQFKNDESVARAARIETLLAQIKDERPAGGEEAAADGVLLVDKPAGVTSHDVVAAARRALAVQRIGHVGTLDPFATGLLVLLIGRATRLAPYVEGEPKVYETTIAFGAETTTDDCTGETTRTAAAPDGAAIDAAIAQLTGPIDQTPPAFSAKKRDGVRAYAAARRGEPVELAAVRVTIHRWCVLRRTENTLTAQIECSGGTYIRALGRDLGRLAGSAAQVVALRRLGSGCFDVADAVPVAELSAADARIQPPLAAIRSMPTQSISASDLQRVLHGNPIAATGIGAGSGGAGGGIAMEEVERGDGELVALVDEEGGLVAIAQRSGPQLQPKLVLRDA